MKAGRAMSRVKVLCRLSLKATIVSRSSLKCLDNFVILCYTAAVGFLDLEFDRLGSGLG
jgi:hypothetical protein